MQLLHCLLLSSVSAMCPWARHINPSLVLVQPRKTRPRHNWKIVDWNVKNQMKQTNKTKTLSSAMFLHCVDTMLYILMGVNDFWNFQIDLWAVTGDFQQCDILTSVDSDEPVQPPFTLGNSKLCSVSSLTLIKYSSDKQRLWSDWAYVQADLRLCWSHIPYCWKSHVAAQLCSMLPLVPL